MGVAVLHWVVSRRYRTLIELSMRSGPSARTMASARASGVIEGATIGLAAGTSLERDPRKPNESEAPITPPATMASTGTKSVRESLKVVSLSPSYRVI